MGSKSFKHKVVGIYTDRLTVDALLNELNGIGYSKNDISVLARDIEKESEQIVTHSSTTYTTDVVRDIESDFAGYHDVIEKDPSAMIKDATSGIIVGAFAGFIALMIPGLGPVIAAGPIATAIAAIVGGAAIGATAGTIIGLLKDEGIPNDRADFYQRHFNKGDVIVIVHTEDKGLQVAKQVLKKFNPHNIDAF